MQAAPTLSEQISMVIGLFRRPDGATVCRPLEQRALIMDPLLPRLSRPERESSFPNVRTESRSILRMLMYHAPAIVLPLVSANEVLGALVVIRNKKFTRREISSLQLIAELTAISLR